MTSFRQLSYGTTPLDMPADVVERVAIIAGIHGLNWLEALRLLVLVGFESLQTSGS